MSEINLIFLLISAVNYAELLELVNFVDGMDWVDVPVFQDIKGSWIQVSRPSPRGLGGDFIWYDLYLKTFVGG